MLGMMSNKGGQNSAVPGQQPQGGGMPDLAAMFRNNAPMGGMGQGAMPGQGAPMPQITQPQRPVLAPPPRNPMPQPVAAPQMSALDRFRNSFFKPHIDAQMGRRQRRGDR